MFHVFVTVDLNGTIIAGDEMGGKSPNKSILTDLLECYPIESADAFASSLHVQQLKALLDAQLGVAIDLQQIIEENLAQFNHANFYDNFKNLISLCIKRHELKINQNNVLKYFLQTEKTADHSVKAMVMEHVLANKETAQRIKETVGHFHQHLDELHVLRSFYVYIKSIKDDPHTHMTLNTFGSEAPRVVAKVADMLPCSDHIIVPCTNSAADKNEVAQTIFKSASTSRLIIQQSNFEQFDYHKRVNRDGKLFPINTSKKGLYVFFDDNLSFDGLEEKGCVNIYDVSTSKDVDFSKSLVLPVENDFPDMKAVVCGKAIVVLVRARLSNTCQDSYLIDTMNRCKQMAENYYREHHLDQEPELNPNQLFSGLNSAGDHSKGESLEHTFVV